MSIIAGIIAVVALIIAIMANNKKQKEIMPTVKTENGETVQMDIAFKNYVKTNAGKDFMVGYLTKDIDNKQITDVMTKGMIKGVGYSMQNNDYQSFWVRDGMGGGTGPIHAVTRGSSGYGGKNGPSDALKFVDFKKNW